MCVVSVYGAASMLLDQLHRHFPEPRRAGQVTLKPAFYMYTIVHIKNINIQFFYYNEKTIFINLHGADGFSHHVTDKKSCYS